MTARGVALALLAAALVLAARCSHGQASTAPLLRWAAPVSMADGSMPAALGGYRIWWGTAPGLYAGSWLVGASIGAARLVGLPAGPVFLAVSAVGADGSDSDFSFETLATSTAAAPPLAAQAGLAITESPP